MLQLRGITKEYHTGGETVKALKGIDLQFRTSEFVSILGPSGCGKTTLLNIVGGLDKYTSGDLIINGKSTKNFTDRDWDSYRNHSIGFVFQSYNLIPHQTVLQNVELALTLSGVSKSERRKRAKKALEEVGLGSQLRKKPSQMSGGQMQRVAIARAIVNNPDIILADEPTGALDTETSVQVMEILKEISKNRLIIMVTHNPNLAEQYSTRIINILDGEIKNDSAPLSATEIATEIETEKQIQIENHKNKKPSMSFFTSFGLSLKNLFTKKGRTALTSFAGSIGIIGISLIYAVSQGTTVYINTVQEDTLSSYPLTLEAKHIDVSTLIQTFMGKAESVEQHENDAVYQKAMVYNLMNSLNSTEEHKNDLKSFKKYLETERANPDSTTNLQTAVTGVQYTYDNNLLIYTKNVDGEIIVSDTEQLMQDMIMEYMGIDMSAMSSSSSTMFSSSSLMTSSSSLWQEMLSGDNGEIINPLLKKQYDLVYGEWPNNYDEIVLVLDENNELNDLTLYALGLISKQDIDKVMDAAINKTELDFDMKSWSYEEICQTEFRTILSADCYSYDEKTQLYTDLRSTATGLKYLYDNGLKLKVTGIIKPDKDAVATMITGSIAYTGELTEYLIDCSKSSDAINAQLDSPDTDIFTGLPFKDTDGSIDNSKKATDFKEYINSLTEQEKAEAYIKISSIPSDELVDQTVEQTLGSMSRADMEEAISSAMAQQVGMNTDQIADYIESMSDEDIEELLAQSVEEQFKAQYAGQVASQMGALSQQQLVFALDNAMQTYTDEQCAVFYDEVLTFSDSTYEDNLSTLGYVDIDSPYSINIYASTFADKDVIEDAITKYNEGVDELSEITYTDYVGLIMSSVTTIINAITYVLIAFVSVSLIVSSIMIGVITLISVQERTKEIGILRAIGASKRNVSSMFNAETMIIGFTSGLLGVGITYLLCIPINIILHKLTNIHNLSAILPVPVAVALIIISVLLTLVAGIIPSRSAAKKDPVVALRSE